MLVCLSPNGQNRTRTVDPATELLVGTIRGVVHFTRASAGDPWRESRRSIEQVHVSSIAYDAESGAVLVGGHGQGGLWISRDGGLTWAESMDGITERHVFHVAVQRRSEGVVCYAGVEPPGLYRSHDLGRRWELLPALTEVPGTDKWTFPPPPHLAHVKNVTWHDSDPDTFYVCVEQGALLRTRDAGESFSEIDSYEKKTDLWYRDVHRTVIREDDPAKIILVGGEGIYRSLDAGVTWQHVQTRFDRLGYPDALVLDPDDEATVYAAGAGDPPRTWAEQQLGTAHAGVIRSFDFGETWHEAVQGLPADVKGNFEAMSLHGHNGEAELFLGTATGEVYHSTDRAETWHEIASGLPPVSKVHHYRWFLSPDERSRIEKLAAAGH
ncbi:hypothetical protein ABT009_30010 [Streptomyces sp. NPDC002896]|uniref:WD40/YVTN/BNR-like repeat-containing protein n=1 Tax=Streptomyces sp. NPDC002896 TaxID=3154438 RepID=UPI00331B7D8F